MPNKLELLEELEFIHTNFDFSEDCSTDLKNYILKHNLANYDTDDILFLSASGESIIGYDDRGTGSPDEDITQSFFYNSGEDDDY
jgi:hypothetical protein